MKKIEKIFLILFAIPLVVSGKSLDTVSVLKQMGDDLRSFKDMRYDYVMEVSFPNGDKDRLKGVAYLDIDDKIYYNECDAFTMIYTPHWFYKADHRKSTLTIINLDKDISKKLRSEVENQVFKNGALNTFLDSIVMKAATIKKMKNEGSIYEYTLGFPGRTIIQKMDIAYNTSDCMLIRCNMVLMQPWQKTPKGIQSIEEKITLEHFKKITDRHTYNTDDFFYSNKDKIELKKYNNYKLLTTK